MTRQPLRKFNEIHFAPRQSAFLAVSKLAFQRELSVRRLLEEFPLSRGEDVQVRVQGSVHALPSLHFESSK